ncbi:hypothetical protein [Streptomyces sp. WMMB 322]|nr:hypothetical protein [Streptomyces sp. WMMB 322]SCK41515.1 hypothetical protein H180DRAFT_03589 [Streptomyces sp. WMMB 322]
MLGLATGVVTGLVRQHMRNLNELVGTVFSGLSPPATDEMAGELS